MIIYLDESGDLGFDFSLKNTSHYLIMTCLVCSTVKSIYAVKKAVNITLKNKLSSRISEVKGSNTSFAVKNYFYKQITKNLDWEILSIAADKQAWLRYNKNRFLSSSDKNLFYDDIAKRLLSQIKLLTNSSHIQIIVDKSKTQASEKEFNHSISGMIRTCISNSTLLKIHHRHSFLDFGLQATDMFGWGIYRKYQRNDLEWYDVFRDRIALEMKFKF